MLLMQTVLMSKRVLGQLPARTKIHEKEKKTSQRAKSPLPVSYTLYLVYFPAHPSVHVCLSLPLILEPVGQTQTNVAGT